MLQNPVPQLFADIFLKYSSPQAPFLHQQHAEWQKTKPLRGLKILHHVPLVQNTLLKIACLTAAGAEVVVTNPNFMKACPTAKKILTAEKIRFVENISELNNETFDIFLDCGAELFQSLRAPTIGAVELTGTGDQIYRSQNLNFPVISIDRSYTKQLETIFGTAVSAVSALKLLAGDAILNKSWLIFGFGKIGRGLAYFCKKNCNRVVVVDVHDQAKLQAQLLELEYVDARDLPTVAKALQHADLVITATGCASALANYPKNWFTGKILANMGILDEYGERFASHEVINEKKPINFILEDPTPIEYIDPELFAHNAVLLNLLHASLPNGVHDMKKQFDTEIIARWCHFQRMLPNEIESWFINFANSY